MELYFKLKTIGIFIKIGISIGGIGFLIYLALKE